MAALGDGGTHADASAVEDVCHTFMRYGSTERNPGAHRRRQGGMPTLQRLRAGAVDFHPSRLFVRVQCLKSLHHHLRTLVQFVVPATGKNNQFLLLRTVIGKKRVNGSRHRKTFLRDLGAEKRVRCQFLLHEGRCRDDIGTAHISRAQKIHRDILEMRPHSQRPRKRGFLYIQLRPGGIEVHHRENTCRPNGFRYLEVMRRSPIIQNQTIQMLLLPPRGILQLLRGNTDDILLPHIIIMKRQRHHTHTLRPQRTQLHADQA